jgi:hypothetical protein
MTTQMTTHVPEESKSNLLVRVLRADGVFAALSGAISVLVAGPIAELFDLDTPVALVLLGIVLLGYGATLLYFAGRETQNRSIAKIAILLNTLWVIGSYAGLLFGLFPVNTAGRWAIALIAEVVAVFAILEYIALRRTR